jgi:hypothetical protein
MFAPQTNPASPAVLLSHKQMFMCFTSIRDVLPWPVNLFPVYQLFLAVFDRCQKTLVLGFMSPLSRVGQRPQSLYRKSLAIVAALNRSIAAPIPPRPKGAGFLGGFR